MALNFRFKCICVRQFQPVIKILTKILVQNFIKCFYVIICVFSEKLIAFELITVEIGLQTG